MLNAFRQRISRLSGRVGLPSPALPRNSVIDIHLPNPYGGRPWLSATFALSSIPHGQGDTVRLRAHIDGCMRVPQARPTPALTHTRPSEGSLIARGQRAAAGAVRGVLDRLPAERLAPLAERRWRSWIDVQVSTSPLDEGADALVPERLRRLWGAGLPRAVSGQPRLGVWSGPSGGPLGGKASLVWLQLDENDMPEVGTREARQGFSLNASIAQLVEPDTGDPEDRD